MMADPVVANDGHSYERAAIAHWLATHNTSPQTREPMVSRELVPNHALRARIAAWRTQRGLDPLPARWIPPQAPAPAPQQPQQRQPRPTALHLTNERMAVVCQAIHGVLNRAPHLRQTLGLAAAPRGAVPHRVEIKILRRVRAESSRRPPRHRRDACSMAWRCRFLAARPSQVGRVAPDTLVDFHTGAAARAVAAARRRGARPLCQRRAGPAALRGRALAHPRPAAASPRPGEFRIAAAAAAEHTNRAPSTKLPDAPAQRRARTQ